MKIKSITLLIFLPGFIYSQISFWQFERKKPILKIAVDMEMSMDLFSENDFVEFNQKSGEAILHAYEAYKEPVSLNDSSDQVIKFKYKIIKNEFKLLARARTDNIYFLIFKKTDITEEEFRKQMQKLKL